MGVVGEVDTKGFGVGVASGAVKPNVTAVSNTKRSKSRKSRDSAEPKSRAARSSGREKTESPVLSEASDKRLPTPPPKDNAFEEFKKERGCEINRILNENKGIYCTVFFFSRLVIIIDLTLKWGAGWTEK